MKQLVVAAFLLSLSLKGFSQTAVLRLNTKLTLQLLDSLHISAADGYERLLIDLPVLRDSAFYAFAGKRNIHCVLFRLDEAACGYTSLKTIHISALADHGFDISFTHIGIDSLGNLVGTSFFSERKQETWIRNKKNNSIERIFQKSVFTNISWQTKKSLIHVSYSIESHSPLSKEEIKELKYCLQHRKGPIENCYTINVIGITQQL